MGVTGTLTGGDTENELALDAVPTGVVTEIFPVVAPVGTFVTICAAVSETMAAEVPLKATPLALDRPSPVMVTVVPTGPDVGEKLKIVGAALSIRRIAEPLDVLPTAQHAVVVAQETPEKPVTPFGRVSEVQVRAPSLVAMTTTAPNAMQSEMLAQDTPERTPIPLGLLWVQVRPPLVVASTRPDENEMGPPAPTTKQTDVLGHEIPLGKRLLSLTGFAQVRPPLSVVKIWPGKEPSPKFVAPNTRQSEVPGQAIPPKT